LLIPTMRAQKAGRIVFCSSVLGLVAAPYRGAYCASKFAIEALADALRLELAPSGIKVILIEPGAIATRFVEHALGAYRRNIDLEGSAHRDIYRAGIARLEAGGSQTFKLGPETVAAKLVRALESKRPKPCGIAAPHPADARPRRGGGKQLDSWAERFTQRHQQDPMEHAVRLAIPFALAAVTCVLLAGLWNMVRGGNPNLSQKLMRWRVLLQFIALCIVMTAIYLAGKFPM